MSKALSQKFEEWFNCWYEYSWNDKEAAAYPEMKKIKKLLRELKKLEAKYAKSKNV